MALGRGNGSRPADATPAPPTRPCDCVALQENGWVPKGPSAASKRPSVAVGWQARVPWQGRWHSGPIGFCQSHPRSIAQEQEPCGGRHAHPEGSPGGEMRIGVFAVQLVSGELEKN